MPLSSGCHDVLLVLHGDAAAEDPEDPSDVSENGWLIWPLEQVARGVCEVRVCLLERDPRIGVPLRIEQVEIYLQYRH